jgi:hypothetical protein
MKARSRNLFCWLFVLVLGLGSAAQAQDPVIGKFDGIEIFGTILTYDKLGGFQLGGLKPVQSFADFDEHQKQRADETVLVVLGDLARNDRFKNGFLEKYWEDGGALLLASSLKDKGLLQFCNLQIDGNLLYQNGKWDTYQKDPDCPLIREFKNPNHPLCQHFSGKPGLATNKPSFLEPATQKNTFMGLESLAEFDPGCVFNNENNEKQKPWNATFGPTYLMAAPDRGDKDIVDRGPIIVLAGENVFIDGMISQLDNDNFIFAVNCASFLKAGRKREFVLFLRDGEVQTSFRLLDAVEPKIPGTPPTPVITTRLINKVLFKLQNEGVMYRALEGMMSPDTGLKLLIALLSLVLLCYAGWRLSHGRWRVDAHVPLVIDPMPPSTPVEPTPLAQRGTALADLGNYAEPAQTLARQWFWRQAGIDPVAWDELDFRFPTCTVAGTWWQRWSLRRQLNFLRDLAQDVAAQSVSARRLGRLEVQFKQLAELVRAEVIRWEKPKVPA